MTAKELDIMVNEMRSKTNPITSRMNLENNIYYLIKGFRAIKRNDLVEKLDEVLSEIDNVPTDELMKIGTFR